MVSVIAELFGNLAVFFALLFASASGTTISLNFLLGARKVEAPPAGDPLLDDPVFRGENFGAVDIIQREATSSEFWVTAKDLMPTNQKN